jgi:hypothetical protein
MSKFNVEVNPTQRATAKQLYAIGNHFAKLEATSPSEIWMLSKAFPAAMMRWNAEHSNTPITHGDIQTWFEGKTVPTKFSKMLTVNKKSEPKAKAAPKPKASKPKASPKPKATPKPKASEMPVGEFKEHFEQITGRVFRLEKGIEDHSNRLATLDAKLDIIMAYITEPAE